MSNSSKNHAEFIQPPFLLDPYATLFLLSRPQIQQKEGIRLIITPTQHARLLQLSKQPEAAVYLHLTGQYFLVDGHKFGSKFLVYENDPDMHHARALIFMDGESEGHMSRLAGIAKKEAWRADIDAEGKITVSTLEKTHKRKHPDQQQS